MADLKLGPLMQINMPVKEIDSAVAFYRDTLGLRHIATFGSIAFVDVGGVRLILEAGGAEQGASVLYLAVADIAAARADLVAQGVEFVDEPHVIFHDEGGMFGEPVVDLHDGAGAACRHTGVKPQRRAGR